MLKQSLQHACITFPPIECIDFRCCHILFKYCSLEKVMDSIQISRILQGRIFKIEHKQLSIFNKGIPWSKVPMIRRKAAMILIVCSHISANHSELVSMEPIFFQNTESFLQSLNRLKKICLLKIHRHFRILGPPSYFSSPVPFNTAKHRNDTRSDLSDIWGCRA